MHGVRDVWKRAMAPPGQEGGLRDLENDAQRPNSRRRGGCSGDFA